jgi:hypothetical protein
MWRIVQRIRVLQDALDLGYHGLRWVNFIRQRGEVIQTYSPENHESFQTRGEEHEDRRWKVADHPNKEHRELCQRDSSHALVNSYDNVSFKIRE